METTDSPVGQRLTELRRSLKLTRKENELWDVLLKADGEEWMWDHFGWLSEDLDYIRTGPPDEDTAAAEVEGA